MGETRYICNNGHKLQFDSEGDEYGCLCTFPHNYEVSEKKLSKWTIASLALLGAGVAIATNKPSSMKSIENSYNDTYYLPDCIPQWIKDELNRILELDKEDNDEYEINKEKEGITMQELTFEIVDTYSEGKINGMTSICAKCIQDNMILNIVIPNREINDKQSIREKLLSEHKRKYKNSIKVGSII